MKDFGFYKDSLTAFFINHGLLQKNEIITKWEISKEGDFLSIYVEGENDNHSDVMREKKIADREKEDVGT